MATEVGEKAPVPSRAYPDADGTEHDLTAALAKGPVLLAIYKSSCGASKVMMPMVERIAKTYGDKGLTTLGVAQDSANITKSFARRSGVEFPILVEGDDFPITKAFDIFATPTTFLIGTDGTVHASTVGYLQEQTNDLGNAVAAQLGVDPVEIVAEDEPDLPFFVPG